MPQKPTYELQLEDGRTLLFDDPNVMKMAAAKLKVKRQPEAPLTLEHAPKSAPMTLGDEVQMRMRAMGGAGMIPGLPPGALGAAGGTLAGVASSPENLPATLGMLGGFAAAPITVGMSAIPAIATAAGLSGIGGGAGAALRDAGRAYDGIPQTRGDVINDIGVNAVGQGLMQAVGGGLAKGAGKLGQAVYNQSLRLAPFADEGLTAIKAGAPNTAKGLAKVQGLKAGQEAAADAAIAKVPKGTTVPLKDVVKKATTPIVQEARTLPAANATVKPLTKQIKNVLGSHPDQLPPKTLVAMQRSGAKLPMPEAGTNFTGRVNPAVAAEAGRQAEGLVPELVGINQNIGAYDALANAMQASQSNPALSQYVLTGALRPTAGLLTGGATYGATGDPMKALEVAAATALLTNPGNVSRAALLAGRQGLGLGQLPSNAMRGVANAFTPTPTPPPPQPQFNPLEALQGTTPAPIDLGSLGRVIHPDDYWTPR